MVNHMVPQLCSRLRAPMRWFSGFPFPSYCRINCWHISQIKLVQISYASGDLMARFGGVKAQLPPAHDRRRYHAAIEDVSASAVGWAHSCNTDISVISDLIVSVREYVEVSRWGHCSMKNMAGTSYRRSGNRQSINAHAILEPQNAAFEWRL